MVWLILLTCLHLFYLNVREGESGCTCFSCLFVFEGREPSQASEVKPQLSDSVVNGGGLGSGLSRGGVK